MYGDSSSSDKVMVIGSDLGLPHDASHPRLWGSFPACWATTAATVKAVSALETAVYKMTGLTAKTSA
jgi:N-acyl-D-aspartate/D-glutamate deacylase